MDSTETIKKYLRIYSVFLFVSVTARAFTLAGVDVNDIDTLLFPDNESFRLKKFDKLDELYKLGTLPNFTNIEGLYSGRCYTYAEGNKPMPALLKGEQRNLEGSAFSSQKVGWSVGGSEEPDWYDELTNEKYNLIAEELKWDNLGLGFLEVKDNEFNMRSKPAGCRFEAYSKEQLKVMGYQDRIRIALRREGCTITGTEGLRKYGDYLIGYSALTYDHYDIRHTKGNDYFRDVIYPLGVTLRPDDGIYLYCYFFKKVLPK